MSQPGKKKAKKPSLCGCGKPSTTIISMKADINGRDIDVKNAKICNACMGESIRFFIESVKRPA